jgi:hypothetical protein
MRVFFWPVLLVLCCLVVSGCSGCSRTPSKHGQKSQESTPLDLAREAYRTATDAQHFRHANGLADKHLTANPDALTRQFPGTRDKSALQAVLAGKPEVAAAKLDDRALYRKFLESVVGLDKAEIEDVESTSFKLLDAHYLDGCYLLRDAARGMPLQGLSPLEQAEFCFHWVTRRVVLHETREEPLPPQFVLRHGQGSSRERALVFLALLQQVTPAAGGEGPHLDGCVIAVPGPAGQPHIWLAGVLVTARENSKEKQDLYLFDMRLGMPVPGPRGKGIATLAQLKADTNLLDALQVANLPYDVAANQVGQAEILLAWPLSGLSARMRFLEDDLLQGHDRINLAVRAADQMEKFTNLKLAPVRVWSAPTRALRQFLPAEEGGIDTRKRLKDFTDKQVPREEFERGFAEEKVSFRGFIDDAQERLLQLADQVWLAYAYEPALLLIRGRLEDSPKRVVRMEVALRPIDPVVPEEIAAQIAMWRESVREAYVHNRGREIWDKDPWLSQLIKSPDEELANPQQVPKTPLSYVVLRGILEPMQWKVNYLLGGRWQEKAERLEIHRVLQGHGPTEARDAWNNAEKFWDLYGQENKLRAADVQARLQTVLSYTAGGTKDLKKAATVLDYHMAMFREAAAARLLRARALIGAGKRDQAATVFHSLANDLDALRNTVKQTLPKSTDEPLRSAVTAALADVDVDGSLYWMQYSAVLARPLAN